MKNCVQLRIFVELWCVLLTTYVWVRLSAAKPTNCTSQCVLDVANHTDDGSHDVHMRVTQVEEFTTPKTANSTYPTRSITDKKRSQNITEIYSQKTAGVYSKNIKRAYSHNITERYSQNISERRSKNITGAYSQNITERYSQNISERRSKNITGAYSQNITEIYTRNIKEMLSQNITGMFSQNITEINFKNIADNYSQNITEIYSLQALTDDSFSAGEGDYFDYLYEDPQEMDDADTLDPMLDLTQPFADKGTNRLTKLKLVKKLKRQPPDYMLELYDRLTKAGDSVTTQSPSQLENSVSDFVESVSDVVRSFPNINKEDADDASSNETNVLARGNEHANETRHHILAFNISSLLTAGEHVSRAELRLYTLVKQDRDKYDGTDRMVSVYNGIHARRLLSPVVSRHVPGHSNGWEAFDVTSMVQTWVREGSRTGDGIHVVKVAIACTEDQKPGEGSNVTAVDIDVDPQHNEGPILVVFSEHPAHRESGNRIQHGDKVSVLDDTATDIPYSAPAHGRQPHAAIHKIKSVIPRAPAVPRREKRLFPAAKTPGFASGVHSLRMRRGSRRRSSCHRRPFYVDFQDVNWNNLIVLAPTDYNAFQCVGACNYPIESHLTPTNHAVIQTLVHAAYPKHVSSACCVPTKLEPISMLYLEGNVVVFKFHSKDMVVTACGCR